MLKDLFLSVFEISLSVGLAAFALILLAPFLNRRYAAKWKYWIWIFFALRLMIPFKGTESFVGLLTRVSGQNASAEAGNADTAPIGVTLPRGVVLEIPEQMTVPIVAGSGDEPIAGMTALDIVALIWLAGSSVIIFFNLFSYLNYMGGIRKRGIPINDSDILCKLQELKEELHIRNKLSVLRYSGAASPMIIGFARPVLVLPEETYRPEDLTFILKHELVHLKRRDVYVKLLLMASKAIHWFNPVIWMMQKEAVVDMELSCDERVVEDTNYVVRKAYTETLFSTLNRACARKTYFSTQFYGGKQVMKKRFLNILMKPRKKNGLSVLACAVILAVCLETLVGCSAADNKKDNEVTLSYIKGFDGKTVSFDTAEWVEVPSERATELGISEDDAPSGFNIYNEDTALRELPLAKDCVYTVLDWTIYGGTYEPVKVTLEELRAILEERKNVNDIVPYYLTIRDGEITDITEQYVP